jgi:hypothetical protein
MKIQNHIVNNTLISQIHYKNKKVKMVNLNYFNYFELIKSCYKLL